jgi:alkanesulfonate monooxygenase SsuD/methylene tetrahydromethanopterin reductase-like flavin-dependent oxidoreductase (luciferase family)
MPAPKIGVFLPPVGERMDGFPGDLTASARHAEELGLESVWIVDQLISGSGEPLLESGIALATAAAATTRVRLGFGVHARPSSASNTA